MRVAFFQFFPPTIWTPGGGETYLVRTREALLRLGVEVGLFNIFSPQRDYDILHVFGSTYQLSDFVVTAKRLGMRVVVSPITYTHKPTWAWKLWRQVDRLLPVPTVYTYRKRIYEAADILLPSSKAMAKQLAANFKVPSEKMRVVYLGADRRFADATPDAFVQQCGIKDFVLQVGRINRRKGQSRLIQALDGSGLNLVFIGQGDPDDPEGFREFIRLAKERSWVHYYGPMPNDSPLLQSAFAAAKVHALPSIGEFPGLVNLEAAIAGANVVSGWAPEVYEYLGEDAFYCDPRSIDSIRDAVLAAYSSPRRESLRKRVLTQFTWDHTAKAMLAVYESLGMRGEGKMQSFSLKRWGRVLLVPLILLNMLRLPTLVLQAEINQAALSVTRSGMLVDSWPQDHRAFFLQNMHMGDNALRDLQPAARIALWSGLYSLWGAHDSSAAMIAFTEGGDEVAGRAISIIRALLLQGRASLALPLLDVVEQAFPSLGDVHCLKGIMLRSAGDMDGAANALQHAVASTEFLGVECRDSNDARHNLARVYFDLGKWEQARRLCVPLTSSPEHRQFALTTLGDIVFNQDPTPRGADKARDFFETAIAENRNNVMAYLQLARIYRMVDDYESATQVLERGLEVFRIPEGARGYLLVKQHRFRVLVSYGQTLLREGNVQEAINSLEEAVRIGQFDWEGNFWLGKAYLEAGQCERAYQEFANLLQQFPNLSDDKRSIIRSSIEQVNACREKAR